MTARITNQNRRHSLEGFLSHLHEWIDCFKLDSRPNQFSVLREKKKASLYGTCDMVYNLVITGGLEKYLKTHPEEDVGEWIAHIQSYQDSRTGWFKEGLINYGLHFKEHSTAFAISALKLLDARPKYDLKISQELTSQKKVERWLRRGPEWGLLYWPGSHRGGGIGAIYATLGKNKYPHERFFDWYFKLLDDMADPEVGFWRIGWIHKINKNRLTRNELGGSVHYYWVYVFLNRPLPFPERIIDATLALQNEMGTWHEEFSYCIDLDAIFCLTRCCKQTNGYRENDIYEALVQYLDNVVQKMNDKGFLFQTYDSAHKLTGYVCAIAEINKFYPELFDLAIPWVQTLDITPWI